MLMAILIRAVVMVAVVLACATGLTAAFGLLVAADFFAFRIILPPVFAALAAAGTALLFCVLALVIGKLVLGTLKKRARRRTQSRMAAALGEVFGSEVGGLADRHPARAVGLALAAGSRTCHSRESGNRRRSAMASQRDFHGAEPDLLVTAPPPSQRWTCTLPLTASREGELRLRIISSTSDCLNLCKVKEVRPSERIEP